MASFVIANHERIDGKGYPKGLKGHEIPYQTKIIGIAEAYDTMINESPYGKTISEKEAIKEMVKCVKIGILQDFFVLNLMCILHFY
jgi:HD-GYP domain-containing protein (c-di-GMP phosphodiesterase class II)